MVLERIRPFRLVAKGDAGVACDAEGVTLGGIPILYAAAADGSFIVREVNEVSQVLSLAYGAQSEDVVRRCHRGLRRVAAWLEQGDLAMAGIEAVMLRLPEVDAEGMAKLAGMADLAKGGDAWRDEPRVPDGQPNGGQWTAGGTTSSPETPTGADRTGSRGQEASTRSAQVEDGRGGVPKDIGGVAPERPFGKPNLNGFYPDAAGGGVFFIPSVSAGRDILPTEVHSLDATAFQVSWTGDTVHLTDAKGEDYAIPATKPAFDQFNATTGRTLGVTIRAFPVELTPARPSFVDWLLQPDTYVPIKPEIAAGESSIPGAALEETTDPSAFEAWRPVSHLEAIGDSLSVVGSVAGAVGRAPAVAEAASEIAGESEPLVAWVARNTPGIVTASRKLGPASGDWLRAGVPTPIPAQVGDALVGQRFNTMGGLRGAVWKSVAGDHELSAGFGVRNLSNMKNGYSPFVPDDFQTSASDAGMRFHLHHVEPIEDGGPVYDLGNIHIVDPRTHFSIHYQTLKRLLEIKMVKRLNRDQLISLVEIVSDPGKYRASSEEVNRALLLFCANCPDPPAAMRVMIGDMTPRTSEQIVDFALAMPRRDVRDVPTTELLPSHPLRYMRLDDM